MDIPPSGVMPLSWYEPRLRFSPAYRDPADHEAKVASLKLHGFQNPVTLSAPGNVIDGYRRLLAAPEAGLGEAPYVVNPAVRSPEQEFAAVLVTEDARSARNPAAHALTLKAFMTGSGLKTQKEVAALTRVSEAKLSRLFTLLTYPDAVIEAVGRGRITMAHVLAAAPLDQARRVELVFQAMTTPMTAGKLKQLAFPPKKKPARHWKAEAGGLSLVVRDDMALVAFRAAWDQIKAQVEERYKATDKRLLSVAAVMNGIG